MNRTTAKALVLAFRGFDNVVEYCGWLIRSDGYEITLVGVMIVATLVLIPMKLCGGPPAEADTMHALSWWWIVIGYIMYPIAHFVICSAVLLILFAGASLIMCCVEAYKWIHARIHPVISAPRHRLSAFRKLVEYAAGVHDKKRCDQHGGSGEPRTCWMCETAAPPGALSEPRTAAAGRLSEINE